LSLREHLMKVGKISEEDVAPGAGQYRPIGQAAANPEAQMMSSLKPVSRTCKPFTEESYLQQYGYADISPTWIELAEQLKFLEESRVKIALLERDIESLIREKDTLQDLSSLEQKINEYKTALSVQESFIKELLEKQGGLKALS